MKTIVKGAFEYFVDEMGEQAGGEIVDAIVSLIFQQSQRRAFPCSRAATNDDDSGHYAVLPLNNSCCSDAALCAARKAVRMAGLEKRVAR